MYARVTSVTIQPANTAEVTRIFNESIVPAVRAASGNRGIFLLIDATTGKGMSITVWNSQAEGEAYDTSGGYREQVAKVAPFFAAPPTMATYEVASFSQG